MIQAALTLLQTPHRAGSAETTPSPWLAGEGGAGSGGGWESEKQGRGREGPQGWSPAWPLGLVSLSTGPPIQQGHPLSPTSEPATRSTPVSSGTPASVHVTPTHPSLPVLGADPTWAWAPCDAPMKLSAGEKVSPPPRGWHPPLGFLSAGGSENHEPPEAAIRLTQTLTNPAFSP